MTNPVDSQVTVADKAAEEAELSKETLMDLDAPHEAQEDARGGIGELPGRLIDAFSV